ncbi:hypothetical protein RMN57_12530 [Kitasatospora sp. CM 4170]|uniref:Uncharacterized protein n=1 Tax=Kitasatospora aburaviensis TaxID=67265 RepID=A0ABW1F2R4_9ACTN|nr:hypothetical protein [Kitasatospora sp. CM 4170]WNM45485.1 hypothetical protein RMN57_12530 [Kitasatospora sp. CM 4170]
MTDQQNTAPAVWDPTARGGAGGWVRGPQQQPAAAAAPNPAAPPAPPAGAPPAPQPPQPYPPQAPQPLHSPMAQAPAPGAVGDQGPPLGARPYLSAAPGHDAPTAAAFPASAPPQAALPGAGFPDHAAPQSQGPYPGAPQPPAGAPGYPAAPPQAPQGAPYPPQAHPQQPYQQPYEAAPYGSQPYGQPYGQPDYATGYEDLDDEDRPGHKRAPLLLAFAVLFVLALGGGILWAVKDKDSSADQAAPAPSATAAAPTGSGSPQPAPVPTDAAGAPSPTAGDTASPGASASPTAGAAGPNAQSQAKALDELLTQGESAKAPIGNAVAKVNSCPAKADIDSSAQVFDSGAKQRDQLLTKLAALSVTDLPGGADAVATLKSAWQLSADIDRAYASWARAVSAQGCSGSAPNTADKKRADELNPQATQAKKDFVAKWKPIADTYGLTTRTQDRI